MIYKPCIFLFLLYGLGSLGNLWFKVNRNRRKQLDFFTWLGSFGIRSFWFIPNPKAIGSCGCIKPQNLVQTVTFSTGRNDTWIGYFFKVIYPQKKPMDHPSHSSVWLALNHSHHIVHSAKWLVLNQSHHFTSRHRHIILEKVQWLTWDDTPFVPALETKFSCTWYHSCFTLIQIKFKLNDFCKTPIGTKFRGRTSCNVNSIESKQQISISQLDDVFSVLLWLQVCHTPNLLRSSAGFKFLQRN